MDLKQGRKEQGASTLSQQLARMLWLDQDKRWKRKLAEMMITLELEQRLSKQQIFEDYANEIYLGSRGSFRIHGFGEASRSVPRQGPEPDHIAGGGRAGGHDSDARASTIRTSIPDRVKERRNVVLGMMRQNGYVTDRDYALAVDAPVTVPPKARRNRRKRRISSIW